MANSDDSKDYTREKGQFEGLESSLMSEQKLEYQSPLPALKESLFT